MAAPVSRRGSRILTGRAFASVAVALLISATPAFADLWYEHYEKGERALKSQNWQEAARQFTQAIEKRSEPGVQVKTYGMNFINYHPYLKLGIAYFNMGQLDLAQQAFDSEERFGAIAKSKAELQNLQTFRRLAGEAAKATEQDRIAQIVKSSLQEARILEQQRNLDDAMAAIAKALAVDPKNSEANAAMDRLRGLAAAEQTARQLDARIASLVSQGRDLLAGGKTEEASSAFQQALLLRDDPEVKGLLTRSQERLKEETQAASGRASAAAVVAENLSEARRLEGAGQPDEALQKLQRVLAVDPANAEAVTMQNRLIRAQAQADASKVRIDEVTRLMGDGAASLKAGDYRKAVAMLNQAIALDPANTSARNYLSQAFAAMSQAILGAGSAPAVTKLVPDIYIVQPVTPVRRGAPDATAAAQVERVSAADFVL